MDTSVMESVISALAIILGVAFAVAPWAFRLTRDPFSSALVVLGGLGLAVLGIVAGFRSARTQRTHRHRT
jgi:hypothetical protein